MRRKSLLLMVGLFVCSALWGEEILALNKGWSLNTSGVKAEYWSLTQTSSSLSFTFPDNSSGLYVDYLSTSHKKGISGTITAQIQVVAPYTAIFLTNQYSLGCPTDPAQVRLYFQSGDNDGQRWWSNPISVVLINGSFTMVVPLTPDQWSGLNGEMANENSTTIANFKSAMSKTNEIGMTFGSCQFGHGVDVSGGPASFYLTSYVIQ
jgi:hypothetical protein